MLQIELRLRTSDEWRRLRSIPHGQALAEFALIAPLFFLLLFGIIEAGRFIFYYEVLNNAAREGARYAIVNGANSLTCPSGPPAPNSVSCDTAGNNVRQKVRDAAVGTFGSAVSVTSSWAPDNGRGSIVTVAATYSYAGLIPILPNITVKSESSLVINN